MASSNQKSGKPEVPVKLNNVVKIYPTLIDNITNMVKVEGFKKIEKELLKDEFDPRFIKAAFKRIMKRNAW